jgi:hypothetical protein
MRCPDDTSMHAQEVQYSCWAAMGPEGRYRRMASFSQSLIESSRRAIDQQYPSLCESERFHKYLLAQYGEPLATRVTEYLKQTR